MKRFFTICLLSFLPLVSNATHQYGGDFYYKYIGDSTNIPHHYEIYYVMVRAVVFAYFPNGIDIDVQSSCYPDTTLHLEPIDTNVNGSLNLDFRRCVNTNEIMPNLWPSYRVYKKDIVLDGPCADWIFSLTYCCLHLNENLVNQPYLYASVHLNNTLGPNSSPAFTSTQNLAACRNQLYTFPQLTFDPDLNDSIRFVFAPITAGPGFPVMMTPGFTYQTPFITNTTNVLDPATGLMRFDIPANTPSGGYAFRVDVENYRLDALSGLWIMVGRSQRTNKVVVYNVCDSVALAGSVLTIPPYNTLFPFPTTPTLEMQCNDTSLVHYFLPDVDCRSISPDASEFRLVDPNGAPIPILRAEAICSPPFHSTTSIALKFGRPLDINGIYVMELKTGNDGDLLLNTCGFPMQTPMVLHLEVVNCTGVIGVREYSKSGLQWGAAQPQPVRGAFRVPYQGAQMQMIRYQFTNLLGQVIEVGQQALDATTGTLFFDGSTWPSGTYLLQIASDAGHHTQKIIVQ